MKQLGRHSGRRARRRPAASTDWSRAWTILRRQYRGGPDRHRLALGGAGRKSPHPRTQLLVSDLTYVITRLGEYYRADEIRAWLFARHPLPAGVHATDPISEARTKDVLATFDRLDADPCLRARNISPVQTMNACCSPHWTGVVATEKRPLYLPSHSFPAAPH